MLTMIVACDRNGAIGADGDMPWRQSTDLQYFKKITSGGIIVMGRKTWDTLPGVLPNRRHIVLSRGQVKGAEVMSVEQVLGLEDAFIIGGGEIYRIFLQYVNIIHRTIIDTRVKFADTFFPDITGEGFELIEENRVGSGPSDDHDMIFQIWQRAGTNRGGNDIFEYNES